MAFDSQTRNKLQRMVGACRRLLADEFDDQLQGLYGIYAQDGRVLDLEKLTNLDDDHHQTAMLLRDRINHLTSGMVSDKQPLAEAVRRVLREQAFTLLNRFAALRMAEERGFMQECVGQGLKSKGFQVFETVARSGLGGAYERYVTFIHGMFDELSLDLGVLFDRWSPFGLLFPREPALLKFFDLLNDPELKPLWREDETIGWIYQYFNDEAERKKMREESAAPRNNRELAVRNQFFTPRYVVEFLTDNTLGRIWYEMTRGETRLTEQCRYLVRRPHEVFLKPSENPPGAGSSRDHEAQIFSAKADQSLPTSAATITQEDLLKQRVFIPHRPLKDPRTILMLDPACGSMHFGLYAFDLFEVIYDEAWELEEKVGAEALNRPPGMKSLHDAYVSMDAFLKDVPRLIIEHNIHGIDIDPRCAQIAGLSLWLRAQKAWQRLGLKPAERPAIKRSNIVCAEPMPGEKELLREFVEREFPAEERGVFLRLLEAIFDKMQLAGEAGSLLKIEEEIRTAIEDARRQWQTAHQRPEFFDTGQLASLDKRAGAQQELPATGCGSLTSDLRSLTSESFWERVEERIYDALRDYAEQVESGGGFQRRLFAEDAARGFAFIDVCRKRYDATVMNPPFGEFSLQFRELAAQQFLGGSNDIITAFVERGVQLTAANGLEGVISSRTVFFAPTSARWRQELIVPKGVVAWVELGEGVLDGAMVEVCMYVVGGSPSAHTLFSRPKSANGEFCLTDLATSSGNTVFPVKLETFRALTGWPFAYWLDGQVFWCLENLPSLERTGTKVRVGLQTGDDFRFIRHWAEVPCCGLASPDDWLAHAKGGDNSPYYTDIHLVVNWKQQGREVKAQPSVRLNMYSGANPDLYLAPGMTFSYRTNRFSPAALPAKCITGVAGMGIFARVGDLPCLLAFLNSSAVNEFISARLGLLEINALYQAGTIQPTPVPEFKDAERSHLALVGRQLSMFTGKILRLSETSRLFVSCGSAQTSLRELDGSRSFRRTKAIQAALKLFDHVEAIVFNAYQFGQQTAEAISATGKEEMRCSLESLFEDVLPKVGDVLSFALGIAFGRWDIRYATGEQAAPELPDPFARLPVSPPGQLQNVQGLPVEKAEVQGLKAEGKWHYPIEIPWDGILVDDPNHPLDIERRIREVIEIIWGKEQKSDDGGQRSCTPESIEHEACEILGAKSLRDYFRKPVGFFADHLKRYSKSRRQAPIYWPLSTASGSYTLWIYYHRLSDQTLFQCVNDFVKPKLDEVNRDIERLQKPEFKDQKTAREKLEELQDFAIELKEFHDELLHVAGLPYKPNLNDGVLITASPLWALFRLPKWQKDLKSCWSALEDGEYDWAHLAYSIWPDRVKKVCKTDRSIAIAHGVEELCDVKASEKKAKRGKKKVEAELSFEDKDA